MARRVLTVVLAMLAGILLAAGPASATYGAPTAVLLQVNGGGMKLSGVSGSLSFDDGNTKFAYSLAVCRESSYTPPNVWYSVNGGQRVPISGGGSPVSVPECKYTAYLISGEPVPGVVITSVAIFVDGIWFDNHNVAHPFERSGTYDNPFN